MVGLGALLQRGGWGRWGGIKRLGRDKEALLVGGGYNGIVSGSMEGDCGTVAGLWGEVHVFVTFSFVRVI